MNPSTPLRNLNQKPNGDSICRNSQQLGATQHALDPYTVYVSGRSFSKRLGWVFSNYSLSDAIKFNYNQNII